MSSRGAATNLLVVFESRDQVLSDDDGAITAMAAKGAYKATELN